MAFSRQECWSGLPFPSPSTTLSSGEPWNLTPGPVLVLSEDLDLHCGPPVCRPDAGVPLHGLLPPRASSTHCPQLRIPGRPASQPTNFVVCFNVSCLFFFFLKQRNVSLKGSLLPSGTLAPGHPLRSLECTREGQSPLPLWPVPCGPALLVSAATTPTGPRGPQLEALPMQRGQTRGGASHLSPQGWQDRIPGLRPGNSASGKPPPRVSLHDSSAHRGCGLVGLRLSLSILKTVTTLKAAATANTPIKLATCQALCFVPGVN